MRILYQHRTLGDGAEGIHIIEMVKALQRLGHEVEMAGIAVTSSRSQTQRPSLISKVDWATSTVQVSGNRQALKSAQEYNPAA